MDTGLVIHNPINEKIRDAYSGFFYGPNCSNKMRLLLRRTLQHHIAVQAICCNIVSRKAHLITVAVKEVQLVICRSVVQHGFYYSSKLPDIFKAVV